MDSQSQVFSRNGLFAMVKIIDIKVFVLPMGFQVWATDFNNEDLEGVFFEIRGDAGVYAGVPTAFIPLFIP